MSFEEISEAAYRGQLESVPPQRRGNPYENFGWLLCEEIYRHSDTFSVSLILRLGTFPEDTKIESDTIAAFLSFDWVHLTGLSEKLCLIFGKINFRVQTKSKATTQQCTLVKKNILPTGCISKHKLQTANFRILT